MQYFFADAPMKKKIQKFSVRGCTALFGHQVQNNFFALKEFWDDIKKLRFWS